MIERVCCKAIDWCIANRDFDPEKKEIYLFAAELIISAVITQIVLLSVAVLLGRLPEMLIYLAISIPLRTYGGGWHAPKHSICTLVQTMAFLFVLAVTAYVPDALRIGTAVLSLIAAIAIIWFRAPVDHPHNPFSVEAKVRARRHCIVTGVISCIGSGSLFLLSYPYWGSLVAYSAAIAVIAYLFRNKEKGGESVEEAGHSEVA